MSEKPTTPTRGSMPFLMKLEDVVPETTPQEINAFVSFHVIDLLRLSDLARLRAQSLSW